jgi:hypothetical protein
MPTFKSETSMTAKKIGICIPFKASQLCWLKNAAQDVKEKRLEFAGFCSRPDPFIVLGSTRFRKFCSNSVYSCKTLVKIKKK